MSAGAERIDPDGFAASTAPGSPDNDALLLLPNFIDHLYYWPFNRYNSSCQWRPIDGDRLTTRMPSTSYSVSLVSPIPPLSSRFSKVL